MDKQTLNELGLSRYVKPETSYVYGTPVSVVGSIEIPIEVNDTVTHWARVYVLDGKEQTLLLVIFDWEDRTISMGKSRAEIQETAVGGYPILRAQSVKVVSSGEKKKPTSKNANLTTIQQAQLSELLEEFGALFSDKPGRAPASRTWTMGQHW